MIGCQSLGISEYLVPKQLPVCLSGRTILCYQELSQSVSASVSSLGFGLEFAQGRQQSRQGRQCRVLVVLGVLNHLLVVLHPPPLLIGEEGQHFLDAQN